VVNHVYFLEEENITEHTVSMKETPRRRITVTSSSKMKCPRIRGELINRMVVGGRGFSARPHPFLKQAFGIISKDDVNGFTSDICYISPPPQGSLLTRW
jgi:hypothetical protein